MQHPPNDQKGESRALFFAPRKNPGKFNLYSSSIAVFAPAKYYVVYIK